MDSVRLFFRLLTLGLLRRTADRVRHPFNAGAVGGLLVLAFFLAPRLRRSSRAAVEAAMGDLESLVPRLIVMAGLAAALAVLFGWGYWLRRVREDVARDPWIVLGGTRRAPSVREILSWTATSAILFAVLAYGGAPAAAALASGPTGYWVLLVGALAASLGVWLAGCLVLGRLLAHRRGGLVLLAGALVLVGATASLAGVLILDHPDAILEAITTAAASLSTVGAVMAAAASTLLFLAFATGYIRVFDLHLRERVRVRLLSRPRQGARKTLTKVGSAAIFSIGTALTCRTMVGRLVLIFAVSLLVGGISTVYLETEGQVTATLFAVALFCFMMADTARRTRLAVGGGHRFLLNHREHVAQDVWRMMVSGQAAVLAATALICFGAIAYFHLSPTSAPKLLPVAAPVVELAVWLTVLAHLLSPRGEGDRWLREVLFCLGAALVVGVVALKVLVFFSSPILLVLQSFAFVALALRVGGREPLSLAPEGREESGFRFWRRKGASL
jgi:hypothetical protein